MNKTESELEIDEELVGLVTAILFGIATVVGLIGNFLAVTVVSCQTNMRSITNILIVSLSTADLLFIVFCIPFTGMQYVLRQWVFGPFWCKAVQYIITVTVLASVYTLVLMSFHRYLAVVHPAVFLFLRKDKSWYAAILVTWFVSVVSGFQTVPFYDVFTVPAGSQNFVNFTESISIHAESNATGTVQVCGFIQENKESAFYQQSVACDPKDDEKRRTRWEII